MPSSEYLLGRRSDLSSYLVHLTRDYEDSSSRKNLKSILRNRCIEARNAYCLFMNKVKKLPSRTAKLLNVVCFTETPLSELNYVVQTMEGRSVSLKPYGLVFDKQVVQQAGGNPVFYINTDSPQGKGKRDAFWDCYKQANDDGFDDSSVTCFLPFVNKVDSRMDFSWEREWRLAEDFHFELNDVFLGLCPQDKIDEFEDTFPQVPWISPRWGRDQIISKLNSLARQPQAGKRL